MALNEVNLLSRLDHPHIIAFYDSFEEDGTLMIEVIYERICEGLRINYYILRWNMQMEGLF